MVGKGDKHYYGFRFISDRTLVFGNKTGVNLHGEIVLGSEDVPTEWMSVSITLYNNWASM